MVRWRKSRSRKREHHSPVLARIAIADAGHLRGRNGTAGILEQRGMKRALGGAGFLRRSELRPCQIGLEELVAHKEPTAVVAVEQVMPAGKPEIPHASRLDLCCHAGAF